MSETEQKPQTEEQPQEGDAPAEATEDQPAKEEQTEGTGEVGADGEAAKEEGGAEQAASAEKEESKPAVAAQEASPPSLEAPQENPFSEDDLEQILQLEASEGEDKGWEKSKKIKGVTVFKKPEKNGVPLIKAYMEFSGIPCDKVLEFFTDAELRKKWSRKTPNYEILEERDDFKIVYTVIKMPMACDDRDIVQCMQVRSDEEQKRHVILYKSCNHPNKPPGKGPIRADVGIMGLVIRPKDGDETSTKVTWLSQIGLKGWALKMIVSRVTVGYPVSLCDDLQQYWKKTTAPKEPEKKEENETPKEEKTDENAEPKQEEGKTEEAAGDAPVENNVAAPVTADDEDIPAADEEEKGEEKAGEEA
ncbi:steroidogenic acute regulatory protein, mitochondrial-like [Acanthaster planci]|uniref:Steroidogenic acute regulatory protein, mitochondrial-like n=1 Tax=Acanthaster planci TaxID=133434 RepID=A0A8B7YF42_ACAPL|nr:steroidogenic acute regulatory protein, mitochondrial-like [Acanthaster planci]